MELTESLRANYVYMQLTGVITVSVIEHNRKRSKRNRGNFWEIPDSQKHFRQNFKHN